MASQRLQQDRPPGSLGGPALPVPSMSSEVTLVGNLDSRACGEDGLSSTNPPPSGPRQPSREPESTAPQTQRHTGSGPQEILPQSSRRNREPLQQNDENAHRWKEWRSWKLQTRWLVFQLFLTLGMASAILALLKASQSTGFVSLGEAPHLIRDNPSLMTAIWIQGLQYTTLPTLVMTLYRGIWEGIVAAIAERQPFVELSKDYGRPPEMTVLLDYRSESTWKAPWVALKNHHYFLSACMASTILATLFMVPATAFLFTPKTFDFGYETAAVVTSEYNWSALLQPFPTGPSVRVAMDWAAAGLIMKAPSVPWTNGTNAFEPFAVAEEDLPAPKAPISVLSNTTTHFAKAGCRILRETEDFKSVVVGPFPWLNMVSVEIRGTDRDCPFMGSLNFDLHSDISTFREISATTFNSEKCGKKAGWSRLHFFSGKYTGDRADIHTISNLSVISCKPSYWSLPGQLNVTLDEQSGFSHPRIGAFEGDSTRAVEISARELHLLIETYILQPKSFDPNLKIQVTNDLSRHIFNLASIRSPDKPLLAETLMTAVGDIFEGIYTTLVATAILQPLESPQNSTAIVMTNSTRLIVVWQIAHFIVACLLLIALLVVGAMFSARQKSSLFEEPSGLLSIAAIAQRSANLTSEITALKNQPGFVGRYHETAAASKEFAKTLWRFHKVEMTIYNTINRTGVHNITRA